ncbi:Lin1244/Lin1753 domain-containing protein [Enterococcus dongliensis]|uniref:DUF4373 domain-containing protein n=1 Tax=Enterococcus dongliensis TaxID=2559925 RepID=A0ABU3ES10_9ENTE|nr:Lin1244/Lin1753 domain-containing protein [Enterococcus dongliensis]MDT2597654.1 DUF4373 domain-containing protein [Enterococcus dongliensis]
MNNYFPHDSNSRNSDKLLPVRMKFGAEGYGIYFMILERLRDEKNYMSVKDYNVLAFDLRVDAGKVKSIVEDFGLFAFTENGECFYSEGFNKRMEIKDEKSKKRSEAGKKGAEKRWQKDSNANSKPMALPTKSDGKESKGKETKVNKSKTNNYVFGVFEFLETNHFGNPYSEPMATDISEWIKSLREKGMSDSQIDDWLIMGAKVASGNNRRFWNYVDGVLRNWDNVAAYTKEDIENQNKSKSGGKKLENTGSSEYDNLGW